MRAESLDMGPSFPIVTPSCFLIICSTVRYVHHMVACGWFSWRVFKLRCYGYKVCLAARGAMLVIQVTGSAVGVLPMVGMQAPWLIGGEANDTAEERSHDDFLTTWGQDVLVSNALEGSTKTWRWLVAAYGQEQKRGAWNSAVNCSGPSVGSFPHPGLADGFEVDEKFLIHALRFHFYLWSMLMYEDCCVEWSKLA